MQRRHALQRLTSLGLSAMLPVSARAATPDLRSAARDAWLFCLPLIEMAGARATTLSTATPNTLLRAEELATDTSRWVTTPNNDTLYARAWIDLAAGPVTIGLPASGTRYLSVALMDMYSNNFAVLGTRTVGGEGGRFTLVGPRDATDRPGVLRSPTRWVWLLARTLVDGPADLTAAIGVQSAITLDAPARPRADALLAAPPPGRQAPWQAFFAAADRLLADNPPAATDLAWLRRMAPLGLATGIGPAGAGFDPARFTPEQAAQIEAGVADARTLLRGARGQGGGGWLYPKPTLGDFGQDYLYRAQVAVAGLAALPPAEAMYLRAVNPQGSPLFDSAVPWRLHFPAQALPPVDSFWSLSMYEATPDGQFFFTPNALGRYAIGDRSAGLQRGADGALDLWIQRGDPGEARRANWLPAPDGKPFSLVLRAYLPREPLLAGSYRLPPLQRLD
jgi:hypothetical protein